MPATCAAVTCGEPIDPDTAVDDLGALVHPDCADPDRFDADTTASFTPAAVFDLDALAAVLGDDRTSAMLHALFPRPTRVEITNGDVTTQGYVVTRTGPTATLLVREPAAGVDTYTVHPGRSDTTITIR